MQINNSELLKIYYDEWKYRLDHMRKQLIQSYIVIFFTTTLPITIGVFEGITIPNLPLIIFPVTGILLTMVFLLYCMSEAARIKSLDMKIKLIIKENFPQQYSKTKLTTVIKHSKKEPTIYKWSMTAWIPIIMAIAELILAGIMLYLIIGEKL